MANRTAPTSSKTVVTPNPEEMAVMVIVPSHLIPEGKNPKLKTPYRDTPSWMDKTLIKLGYGDYIFTLSKGGGDDTTVFLFGKEKSPEDAKKPYKRIWKKHGNHRWPPILKSLEILADRGMPRSSNALHNGQNGVVIGPNYYDRYVYIPDCNEGSRFRLDEFVSAEPFRIPRYRTPVATAVQFSIPGLSGGFQEALHDDIVIPATRSGDRMVVAGQSFSVSGMLEGQVFPKTNFKTWLPYYVYCEQEQDQSCGLYYMQRIKVFPPIRPRAIRR